MPFAWDEKIVSASISGDAGFEPGVLAKPFSVAAYALRAPLVDAGARFNAAVHWGDDLMIETRLGRWGNKSFELTHQVYRGDTLCVDGKEIRVTAGRVEGGPARLAGVPVPAAIRQIIGETDG